MDKEVEQSVKKEKLETLRTLIENQGITDYADFTEYVEEHCDDTACEIARRHTKYFEAYLRSRKRIKDKENQHERKI